MRLMGATLTMKEGWNIRALPRKFFSRFFYFLIFLGVISIATAVTGAERYYKVRDNIIEMIEESQSYSCRVGGHLRYAVESYDGEAIIISDRGYIKRADLYQCGDSIISATKIPSGVGFLSDVNIKSDLYISLDFVSTRPLRYLATVAKLGSSKNLISVNGIYKSEYPLNKLLRYSFLSSGEAGASVISLDGSYVAPNGEIDCDDNAFPGVWDIRNNLRVKTGKESCLALFKR